MTKCTKVNLRLSRVRTGLHEIRASTSATLNFLPARIPIPATVAAGSLQGAHYNSA